MKIHLKDKNGVTLQTANKYCEEDIEVRIDTEELNILPSTETQVKEGMFNKVTVEGEPNLLPENIKEGTEIFGVEGTGKVLDIKITDASYLFAYDARVDYLNELLSLCTNVSSTEYMFNECKQVTELDFRNFDTSNVTNMRYMFDNCINLNLLDVSNFDTSNVTDMSNMFYGCKLLTTLDVSNFDTTNVTNMSGMFSNCENLTDLDVSNFDTHNVTNMSIMFYGCKLLTTLDVSNFDTTNVTNMGNMFASCFDLTELDLRNFDMSKVTSGLYNMFNNTAKLETIKSFKNLGKGYTQKTNNYTNYKLILNTSPLSHESLIDIITNGLYDLNLTYDVANGGTLYTQTLQLGTTNLAKLTAEEIAIATSRGWNVI